MKTKPDGKFLLILLAAVLGIFVAPWFVPVREASTSQSYTYGFNNTVALLALGGTLGLLFLRSLWRAARMGLDTSIEEAMANVFAFPKDGKPCERLLPVLGAAVVFFCALLAGIYAVIPYDDFWEMGYFLPRIEQVLMGRKPYIDFAFLYGPALVYLPAWVYKMAGGALSVEQAYLFCLLVQWALGLALLAYIARALVPHRERLFLFLIAAIMIFNPTLGCNYTPLRFLLSIAALAFVCKSVSLGRFARAAAGAFVGPWLAFTISPEMGIALTLALAIYLAALARTPARRFTPLLLAVGAGGAAGVLPWSTQYLGVLFSYGSGSNIPMLPGIPMIIFLGTVFFVLPPLAVFGVRHATPAGAAALAFCVASGLLLAPCCSRCDMGHIFLNGLGIILIASAILARWQNGRWFRPFWMLYFVFFLVIGQWPFLYHAKNYLYEIASARAVLKAQRSHPVNLAREEPGTTMRFSKAYPLAPSGLDALLAYGPMSMPLGGPEEVRRFLLLHSRLVSTYLRDDSPDVITTRQVARDVADISRMPRILVPKAPFLQDPDSATHDGTLLASDLRFLRNQSLFPLLWLKPKHPLYHPRREVAAAIAGQFDRTAEFGDCWILTNRAPVALNK